MSTPNFSELPLDSANAAEDTSFASILAAFEQSHTSGVPEQPLRGTVVSVDADWVVLDIGRKNDGLLPVSNFRDAGGQLSVRTGDQLLVSITGRNEDGAYLLSTLKVERPKDWAALQSALDLQKA